MDSESVLPTPSMQCQAEPAADSPPFDPLEGLAATYFQLEGYITSSNKWFWVWEPGKQQRGYQDIDVLAVNGSETVVASVTGNLDDKVRRTAAREINLGMVHRLSSYFDRCFHYLETIPDYRWLVAPPRRLRRVVVYASGQGLADSIAPHLVEHRIELLDARKLMTVVQSKVRAQAHIRTNNQILKLIQLLPRSA